jgi:predicted helicase
MASRARLLANVIAIALESDEQNAANSTLRAQMDSFKQWLIHDITPQSFSDIYAQTIAYGLFAARYHDPTLPTFSRIEAATLIPPGNPFLRSLFQYIAGFDLDTRIAWIVDELITIFLATDVAQVMRNFGRGTAQQDPVIHFYETFLAAYDPALRKSRGVWYTPQPVVDFIVRATDTLLKTHFALPEGLADTSKTTIAVEAQAGKQLKGRKKSPTAQKEIHRVQILDPATGTGTFLAQTVRHLHTGFATMPGAWSGYVHEHLLPRLNGFELLMASYAMAHLKLDMLLTETGYTPPQNARRLNIFLTNSLEEHHPDTGGLFTEWLSNEAKAANHIKRETPVMVVMGNPPYSGHSANKGTWIASLLDPYKKEPSGDKLQEKNPKWLNDDYVKFIRLAQYLIDRTGNGIVALITNNGYLDNPTFRGMRHHLMQSFDEIFILDLHGNSKKKETAPDGSKDENVFDITQGVGIALMVKTGKKAKNILATIRHADLYGKRQYKYDMLHKAGIACTFNETLQPASPLYLWVPRNAGLLEEYEKGFSLTELLPVSSVGVVTSRDDLVIDAEKAALEKRMQKFFTMDVVDIKRELGVKENNSWKLESVKKSADSSLKCNFD